MAAPTVTSVSPSTGAIAGSTVLIIAGTNFTGTTSVTLGGVAASDVSVVDTTHIYAKAPAHAAGVVDVAVTTPDGTGTGVGLFTYSVAVSPAYNLYLFDDCCHVWISTDTGNTFTQGCTPGGPSTPAPDDPGQDPHGVGTLLDNWIDAEMAINDADYLTLVAFDEFYNHDYGIIGKSLDGGRNLTWTLIDPEAFAPAFVNDPDHATSFRRGAISGGAETILAMPFICNDTVPVAYYPRISRNGGSTWSDVTGLDASITWAGACFGSTASQVMYAKPLANAPFGLPDISPAYLRKSTDWGVNWTPLTGGPDTTPAASSDAEMRLRCSADGEVVVLTDLTGNLWVSQDGGISWINHDLSALFVSPGGTGNFGDCGITPDGTTIIACLEHRINGFNDRWPEVFVSTDSGTSFTRITGNLVYPASVGPPVGSAPGTEMTGCTQCNVSPDGLGMVVTFSNTGSAKVAGKTEPNGLAGAVIFANVSVDGGATFKLVSFDADPYESSSALGAFTGIFMTPPLPPVPLAGSGRRWVAKPGPVNPAAVALGLLSAPVVASGPAPAPAAPPLAGEGRR